MNFSFEGNYKPKRNINLGGARSHEDKKALLAKAQAERRAREHQRLRFRSAVKIQAFYRGRREAISVRCRVRQTLSEELNALGRPEHPVMTFSTSDRDQIVSCMRYCLLLVQGPMHDVSGLVRQLCDFLLSRPAQSDLLRFMHLFYDCGNNSEMIDEMTWLSALFTTRVILPILETSVRDEQTLLRFLSLVINPTTYNRIQRPNFVPHTTFMRIFTHIYFYGHLMNTLRQQLLRETLPNEAFHIVLSVIRCQPPYDFPPSEISRWKPSREVPTFPSMFGLFSGNVSSASSVEGTVTTAAQSETRLTRETILRDLLTQVFSIPFLADRIPKDWLVLFMSEMPFSAALETLLRLHETRRLSEDHTPQQVVGLLMNITQLGNMEAGMHMDGGFHTQKHYFMAIQYLLSDLPPTYLNDPELEDRLTQDSDADSDNSDVEDVVMAEAPKYADPGIRERLQGLCDADKIDVLVKHLIRSMQTSGSERQALVGHLAGLLGTFIVRWPSQKDTLLNTLLYRRWWMDDKQTQLLNIAQMLWKTWTEHAFTKIFDDDGKIMSRLGEATQAVTDAESAGIWAVVFLLSKICSKRLLTIGDDEFFKGETTGSHLEFEQMIAFSRQLKNLSFVLFWRASEIDLEAPLGLTGIRLSHLRSTVTQLVQQVHTRVSRRISRRQDDWLIKDLDIGGFSTEAVAEEYLLENDTELRDQQRQPSKAKLAVISPRLGVLNNIPFVIPFEQRVEIFRKFVRNDRDRHALPVRWREEFVTIRRHHVFEDGFTHLYHLGAGLKGRVAISFVDEFNLTEAGIDGGGVFKEFLTNLGHEAFDTNFGLFLETADNLLYPNPGKSATTPTQLAYYEFLGLIIGKALYEGILLDVAFADFFLKKCLGGINYLDDLPSLDPGLYNGLMAVKNFRGNFEDLALDFTLTRTDNGQTQTIDLVPNGSHTPVTRENCIRYVYLVANYRLNVEIAKQSRAFLRGLSTIVDVKWLRMFNQAELQILLGGASVPIDLEDLRKHTVYSGFEGADNNETVQYLWRALESFDNTERQKFLKFVTSCSRPPLLGFRELQPKLCVRSAGEDDHRLPTSATCINLLKLPRFSSYSILRTKLLYAINAEAGFDLS